jgi:CDP-glycerol glycerophosphotransferase
MEKNLKIPKKLSNITDISFEVDDIQEILPFVDILITDYSSTFFDFILTRKPIIYYSYDLEDYLNNCRGMYYDYYKELPGPFAKTEYELINLMKEVNVWSKDKKYIKKYNEFLDKFNKYKDGNSAERLINMLFKIS